jgi:hypothetical protein
MADRPRRWDVNTLEETTISLLQRHRVNPLQLMQTIQK